MKSASQWFLAALIASLMLTACGSEAPQLIATAGARGSKPESSPTQTPASCVETDPHPIAEGIAKKYDVEYEQVIDWFCGGESFDDILLALETHRLTELPVEQILERANEVGWDQLWDEVGLIETPEQGQGP